MKFLVLVITVMCCTNAVLSRSIEIVEKEEDSSPSADSPDNNDDFVEITMVEEPEAIEEENVRQKRQFGFPNFSNSQALANANSFAQYQGPQGFGATSGIAGAQAFQNNGPLGGFGANAANSGTQGFNVGPGGFNANAGFSASQNYNLPNGHHIGLSVGETFSNTNGQGSLAQSGGLTYD
ncbi:hypothetical protein PVAND_013231 [Polypedilum vanderplanki]|uniref:Uncharacterized protein n=1 Tax=Polypedilum vanderplanki TaxID=319348 RepID=A0A9J6CPT8_POLVA|nr:hypothetical protein PVAND_013231 [Polypedilum vanderplanki]